MAKGDTARKLAVTALGLGCLPVAPGTWGSAGAVVFYVALRYLMPGPWHLALLGAGIAGCLVLGMALCPWAEEHYGKKDPRPFVLDEVAGQWVACYSLFFICPAPFELIVLSGPLIACCFVAFRFFDIIKPFPIRRLENLRAGWGVMLDDLLAGAYAAASCWVMSFLLPLFGVSA
ncbi:MAG: phosphatidylglycerophosphatase A [Candidatus Brocadiia bacterium]|jgi:phosphatidylglycerophosphatase A|nr:phosphatidylglycerophosphatase A [Candidatus Brocadiia bacterium]